MCQLELYGGNLKVTRTRVPRLVRLFEGFGGEKQSSQTDTVKEEQQLAIDRADVMTKT